jgi:hypothetical protein
VCVCVCVCEADASMLGLERVEVLEEKIQRTARLEGPRGADDALNGENDHGARAVAIARPGHKGEAQGDKGEKGRKGHNQHNEHRQLQRRAHDKDVATPSEPIAVNDDDDDQGLRCSASSVPSLCGLVPASGTSTGTSGSGSGSCITIINETHPYFARLLQTETEAQAHGHGHVQGERKEAHYVHTPLGSHLLLPLLAPGCLIVCVCVCVCPDKWLGFVGAHIKVRKQILGFLPFEHHGIVSELTLIQSAQCQDMHQADDDVDKGKVKVMGLAESSSGGSGGSASARVTKVIHFKKFGNRQIVAETSLEDFLHGKIAEPEIVTHRSRIFSIAETLKRARAQLGISNYTLVQRNCEHLVEYVHTNLYRSRQVRLYGVLAWTATVGLLAVMMLRRVVRGPGPSHSKR